LQPRRRARGDHSERLHVEGATQRARALKEALNSINEQPTLVAVGRERIATRTGRQLRQHGGDRDAGKVSRLREAAAAGQVVIGDTLRVEDCPGILMLNVYRGLTP